MSSRGVQSWSRRCPFCNKVVRVTNFMRLRHPDKTEGKRSIWYVVRQESTGTQLWVDNTHFDACFRERGEVSGWSRA